MRIIGLSVCVVALGACTSLRSSSPPILYATPAAALDCAEGVLERSGFQVQGDDVGARSWEHNLPGRRETMLRARQNSGTTSEIGWVSVYASPGDSSRYMLLVSGASTRTDGTQISSLLHEQGVNAVLTKCGARRNVGTASVP